MELDPQLVHQIFGGLILLVVLPALAKEAGLAAHRSLDFVLPAGLLAAGALLVLDPILFHGGDFGAEGLQHQWQGAVALVTGGIELGRARGRLRHWGFGAVLPVVLVSIGLGFIFHSQHGAGDLRLQLVQHRILGATVILAGLVKGAAIRRVGKGNWASAGWLLVLVCVAFELFLYVEGGGAHGGH